MVDEVNEGRWRKERRDEKGVLSPSDVLLR